MSDYEKTKKNREGSYTSPFLVVEIRGFCLLPGEVIPHFVQRARIKRSVEVLWWGEM